MSLTEFITKDPNQLIPKSSTEVRILPKRVKEVPMRVAPQDLFQEEEALWKNVAICKSFLKVLIRRPTHQVQLQAVLEVEAKSNEAEKDKICLAIDLLDH